MATYQQIELQKHTLNDNISVKVSIYSESLRNRLGKIADFKLDFNRAFDGFVENTLPKDNLYKQIEEEQEAKRKKKQQQAGAFGMPPSTSLDPEKPILPDPSEQPHEVVTKKVAKFKAEEEKDRIKKHEEEQEQRAIENKQNNKKKKKKKTEEVSEDEEQVVNHEQVEFKLAKQFDQQINQLKKVDYEMTKISTQGKVKALQQSDLKVYENIEEGKMDKKEIQKYLKGDEEEEKKEVDLDELNKDYGKDLDQHAYQDFWKDEPRKRGSQSVKPQRPASQEQKLAQLTTPERKRRAIRDQFFPEIQKNSVWKNKDIDISTLYEDPLFDFNRPQKKRKMKLSIDGGILNFGKPILPPMPQTTQAASQQLPEIEDVQIEEAADVPQNIEQKQGPIPDAAEAAAQANDNIDAAQNFFTSEEEKKQQEQKAADKKPAPKVDQGQIDTLKREKKKLEEKLEITKKTFKIELQHAKKKAIEMSEEMLEQKLTKMRETYEEEFENLAKQFEVLKGDVDEARSREERMKKIMIDQEAQIVQMNNLYEAAGRDQRKSDEQNNIEGQIEGEDQSNLLDFVIEMSENPESVHPDSHEVVNQGDILLTQPFDFYSFSVNLNYEQQIDIANRTYIKFYKKKINDLMNEKEAIAMELESNRRLLNTFKQASEKSARKIKELEIKEAIVAEERVTLQLEADRKVKKLSGEYVELYKQLGKQFDKYKEFIVFELESHEGVRTGLEKVISKKDDYIDQLTEALSIPRQHFKFIENLQAEEIVKQKDEIVQEMAANMGVPPDKLLSMLYKKEVAKKARLEVEAGLKEDAPAGSEDGKVSAMEPQSPASPERKSGLGAGPEEKKEELKVGGKSSLLQGEIKLQKDISVKTLFSQATADTMEGSLMAPPFKFGQQKQYKPLGEFASREQKKRPKQDDAQGEKKEKVGKKEESPPGYKRQNAQRIK